MFYYRLNKNGKILDCSNYPYHEDAIQTTKNIILKFDGSLIFEEEFYKTATTEERTKQKKFEEESLKHFL